LLEPWLRELGFSVFYGSILIKLYRILTEFQTRKAHRVCFRDKDQIVYLLAIVLIVVGYMSAWTALMLDGFFFGQTQTQTLGRQSSLESPQEGRDMAQKLDSLDGPSLPQLGYVRAQRDHRASRLSWQTKNEFTKVNRNNIEQLEENGAKSGQRNLEGEIEGAEFGPAKLAATADQLGDSGPEQLTTLARNLHSFANLFSGLLENEPFYDESIDSFTVATRCRKLTWDYVTELSKFAILRQQTPAHQSGTRTHEPALILSVRDLNRAF